MIVSKQILSMWTDLESIVSSFENSGFNDITINRTKEYADVSLQNTTRTLLRIINSDESFAKHFKMIKGQVRYLLLFNENDVMFVKSDLTDSGARRYLKFKFSKSNPQNTTLARLNSLKFDYIYEFDKLFDTKEIVKKFYEQYKKKLKYLDESIEGIKCDKDRAYYAQILFYRLIFLCFIQTKGFLSNDNQFLINGLKESMMQQENFYRNFLNKLFFDVLNAPLKDRDETCKKFGHIPFLNGGLFRQHRIEYHNDIVIKNDVFEEILCFLSSWMWYVDETADHGEELAINPEILGNIFEKTITDQKGKGAYYTPIDVTKYITESTIISYCINVVNKKFTTEYVSLKDIKNKNHAQYLYFGIIRPMTVLDNACGSGEFLLSVSKLLFDIYSTTWDKIKNTKTKLILDEQKKINNNKSSAYYFKRRIISFNLFGVDLEEEATEICKLRLWLSLVSEMSISNTEPLPNIDYNIMNGNSIIGYIQLPEKIQSALVMSSSLGEIISKIDSLKEDFKNEHDPTKSDKTKETIDENIRSLNHQMNKSRNADLFSEKLTLERFEDMLPFHYRLHFNWVLKNEGFDIIVGNPPYVEYRNLKYPTKFLSTYNAKNAYAYFVEISLNLLKKGGQIGYIIPIAGISTERMTSLQKILIERCSKIQISNYDDRPGKLFEGIDTRSSIILATVKRNEEINDKCRIFTSGYKRWHSENRSTLFLQPKYVQIDYDDKYGSIPKIGDRVELKILKKITKKCMPQLICQIDKKSSHVIWYHNAPRYWIRAMDTNPNITDNGIESKSSHIKPIYLKTSNAKILVQAIMNSSLFYWFFIKMSNCRDLTLREIEAFRINVNEFSNKNIQELTQTINDLMTSYWNNSRTKINKRQHGSTIQYTEFYPKKSKSIIDKIDDILSEHYNLNKKEANFIKEFDEKFRMGSE